MSWLNALGLSAALALPSALLAEGYSVVDLGVTSSESDCMAQAESVLERYKDTLGASSVSSGTWVVYGWDMEPGDQDVVITCVGSTSGEVENRAVLVIHGAKSETERFTTRDVLKGYWQAY
ncbi:hypothetical protein [uncultured Shimia sp.]|uniref:hypothetical protein n=1 Tax=uncultured Shimia sp. TaxID=573152 RepID=UPI0026125490|nr:hypothetical protein [uncultured Shimia sp.]